MGPDLLDVNLEWLIELARQGDGEQLADLIRNGEPLAPLLREFLADVVAGKIRLKRPRKRSRTYLSRVNSSLPEKHAVQAVRAEMRGLGRQRDTKLRAELTEKWGKVYGVSPVAIADYLKTNRSRRRR
jgi:hypothetical protein